MPSAPRDLLALRHQRLRESLSNHELDALIITHLPNVSYLTNFSGTAGIAVLTRDAVRLLVDSRYVIAVEELLASEAACPGGSVIAVRTSYDECLIEVLERSPERRVGFEAAHVSVARHRSLEHRIDAGVRKGDAVRLIPTERIVERARLVKDPYEIDVLRSAAAHLSDVAHRVLSQLACGLSERDVAALVDWNLRQAGFERPAFETIVGSGPRGALPHGRPTGRKLEADDLVVLDFGGVYDGYCVDLTRTVSVGSPGSKAQRVHGAVAAAHAAAVAAVRAGATAGAVDAAARQSLERDGLAEYFGHGTGHGLGLEIHEEPRLSQPRAGVDDTVLQSGMVFTIEPGAYLPGWGGVRIEDDVLVTPEGCELLTNVSRELLGVGRPIAAAAKPDPDVR